MIELIKKAHDRKFDDLKALTETQLPIVMYGAGSYAEDVGKFLQKQGIKISAYCVDSQWLKPDMSMDGKMIISIEQVTEEYDDFVVVIGFADYKSAAIKLETIAPGVQYFFIDAPNQLGFFNYDFILEHKQQFEESYNLLEDQLSEDIFVAFINSKLSGDPSPLYKFANFDQYFSDPMVLTEKEVMVDCGAYDGDTILSLLKHTNGKYEKIFAFEPNGLNFEKLQKTIRNGKLKNVELISKGAWSKADNLMFEADANMTIVGALGGEVVAVEAIDNIVGDAKVSLIKMDIEGAELEALRGAKKTIQEHHPKLAICVYHKPDDLITIPQYIKSVYPNYRFYLRHHQYMSWEMVLYALPIEEI